MSEALKQMSLEVLRQATQEASRSSVNVNERVAEIRAACAQAFEGARDPEVTRVLNDLFAASTECGRAWGEALILLATLRMLGVPLPADTGPAQQWLVEMLQALA